MRRRNLLAAGAAAALTAQPRLLGRPAVAAPASVLRYVPSANLTLLDPVWSTAYISLCHGYAVFDALYATDAAGNVRPQMAEGHEVSPDGLTWTIRLRDGLRFHDGEPVRAADCVASLARWCARQATGQVVGSFVAAWEAADDRTLRARLHQPFPNLAYLMAHSVFPAFVMPERLAQTDPGRQVTEMVGSGPFRFVAGEYVSGALAVYERFAGYVPRGEAADWTSGGKVAKVDRIEWRVLPDGATAAAALQQGEVDWLERPVADLVPVLAQRRDITLKPIDPTGWAAVLRSNQLNPPFDNPRLRRAVLKAVNQEDFMRVAAGDDPQAWRLCRSAFPCGTRFGDEIGAPFMPADPAAAKAVNFLVRGLGQKGYFGWYENAEVEALTQRWLEAGEEAEQRRLSDAIQRITFETVPNVPLGQYVQRSAWRTSVQGVLQGPATLSWNVSKA
ncbi:ABC transporter substrate-binding protein [Roseomonas sp. OT10]|uniref:ABC transporter substrate-binding protein n=1 Tax=Roseomonas cutis TaxID=2897332 RepID=UPI001E5C0DA6|nr:ABC transporter substrate-binding protein [Roseomonas sp. OT10]UFN47057.1 ABC transporter substrate-binding protein [Roseomonas sp. OT10]